MTEFRIRLNVLQARKIAELLEKAVRCFKRGEAADGFEYAWQAHDVLMGVLPPEDGAAKTLYDLMDWRSWKNNRDPVYWEIIRESAVEALAEIERKLYVEARS